MRRWLDFATALFLGVFAVGFIVAAELAGMRGDFAEGTFRFLHGVVFFVLFGAFRFARVKDDAQ